MKDLSLKFETRLLLSVSIDNACRRAQDQSPMNTLRREIEATLKKLFRIEVSIGEFESAKKARFGPFQSGF